MESGRLSEGELRYFRTKMNEAVNHHAWGAAVERSRAGMESVPKPWEHTVRKLKNHPEISNPFALANWMNDQGYTPGGKK